MFNVTGSTQKQRDSRPVRPPAPLAPAHWTGRRTIKTKRSGPRLTDTTRPSREFTDSFGVDTPQNIRSGCHSDEYRSSPSLAATRFVAFDAARKPAACAQPPPQRPPLKTIVLKVFISNLPGPPSANNLKHHTIPKSPNGRPFGKAALGFQKELYFLFVQTRGIITSSNRRPHRNPSFGREFANEKDKIPWPKGQPPLAEIWRWFVSGEACIRVHFFGGCFLLGTAAGSRSLFLHGLGDPGGPNR